MEIDKQYDKIGQEYINGQNKFFSKKIDYSRNFIKNNLHNLRNKRVLDLGCGDGRDILFYEGLNGKDVYGIDSSKFMVERAKRHVKKPQNIFVANMGSMPFKNEFFDIVIGRFSIHYIEDLDKVYKEISRVLKKKGTLIIIAHHPFLGFMNLGARNYLEGGLIKIELYDNKVPLTFPHHSINDYFSKIFFKFFILDLIEEEPTKSQEYSNKWNIPSFIAFKAIKR